MNKVVLLGRLTKDPDLRYAAGNDMAICRFTLAVNRMKKDDGADFINCVAFKKTAETIANHLTKGRQIAVAGNIRTGSYDAQDGTKRYTTDVVVETFDFCDSKGGNASEKPNSSNNQEEFNEDITPVEDGDMPF